MSVTPSSDKVVIVLDRAELARRGRLGGLASAARRDSRAAMEHARAVFDTQFTSDEERRAHFAKLGRRSGVARRRRRDAAAGVGGAS